MKRHFSNNFGRIEPRFSKYESSKAVIIPVPYERTTSYGKGTVKGPSAIINASKSMEWYDEELKRPTYKDGICTKDDLKVARLSPEAMVKLVEREVAAVLKDKKIPVVLGGEHTVSCGAAAAAASNVKDLSVLQLDAHYDLKDKYGGIKFSHACVGRRILEYAPVVQCGVRSLSEEEAEFLSAKPAGINVIDIYQVKNDKNWKNEICRLLSKKVYITIDLDVFDPSEVPAVGTPEPGGITWYEILNLLQRVTASVDVIGFDVVELAPIKGMLNSDFLAAKLIYRLLGYMFGRK